MQQAATSWARLKRLLPSPPAVCLTRIVDSHCLLLPIHLVHLRVLRIYSDSGMGNEGVKMLANR